MKILVTGAAGYKGTQLVDLLLAAGHEVFALDDFRYNQKVFQGHLRNSKFHLKKTDVRNHSAYQEWLKQADAFIPLACLTGAPVCEKFTDLATAINHQAIVDALKLLSKNQAVLFPMTNSGYGVGGEAHCDEKSPLRPLSHYARLKVETEKAILDHGNSVSFRFATLFGASYRMRYDLLVNDFMWKAQTDKEIHLFEGHFRRNFLHVADAARVYLHALDNWGSIQNEIYNVGLTAANMTKLELCREIQKVIPDLKITDNHDMKDPDKRDYVISNAKIEATGFSCKYTLQDGLKELKDIFVLGRTTEDSNQ
ncbi:NAD(P)-dependent oxidoreductase [Bdellovibrio sp. KM01]|uniref:NAD-dependent epimerase/dehydratase family protein n=1 Tax=Bdellovibrio sp. KM01 TaxID=2748865 RepID=UPI0015EAA377|nr:NAD(P)-dependent oxidoreductase [Bdellovibrio sp. KM01]QLY25288.1 NAD(P)-dependent oxidoreductase [Bdellovibrio sp. KM01]